MIRDSLYFKYAGEDSRTYGLLNVNLSRGLLQEPFTARGNIIEEKVKGRERPYFKRVEKDPLSFSINFAFEETWDEDKIRSIARWLTLHEIYQPLQFIHEDYDEYDDYAVESRIFYALVVEDTHVVHNALKQGYITLTFRCDSWWSYLPTVTIDEATIVTNGSVILPNDGDLKLFPKIRIEKTTSDGPLVITNYENDESIEFYEKASGINFLRFNGTVYDGETITIGDEIYEFDTGDGDVDEYDHILVDVSATAAFATAKLEFTAGGAVKEGEAIIIGRDVYEFDVDGVYRYGNIVIDISDSVATATGVLTFTDNPSVYDYIIIGNTRYIFDRGTNQSIIKTLNHAVDAKSGFYAIINRSDDPDEYESQKFVVAENKDFLKIVEYTNNNPFENPTPINSQIIGQQPGDVIEIYNSKYRGEVETGTTTSHIVTTSTQGLRSGDLVGAVIGDELEFKKIISVSNNNSLTLESALSSTPTAFYAFNRVALRVAESVAFHIPNVVVIGADMEESARNLVKAINVDGIPGVDFGIELLPNLLVEADFDEYESDEYQSVVNLTSLFPGSEGNFISTTVSDGIDASFANNTLVGGEDCDVGVAISKLVSAVNDSGTEDIEAVGGINEINFTYEIAGTIGNGIACLSNAEDAEWATEYFEGGEDPSITTCYNALKNIINAQSTIVTAEDTYEDNILRIEHKLEGLDTNIPTQSDTFNAFWASRRLSGGRNELESGEIIFIDTERQQIESDTDTDGNRYDCFNDEFITLELGNNEIFITGNCKIQFWLQPRTIQG